MIWTQIDTDVQFNRLSHTSTLVGLQLFIIGGHDGEFLSAMHLFTTVGQADGMFALQVIVMHKMSCCSTWVCIDVAGT